VQKKAVKMVSGLTSKEYEDRCREISVKTLVERRLDQDMAQVYRFHKGSGGLQADKIFESSFAVRTISKSQNGMNYRKMKKKVITPRDSRKH
jgi:hypothetical protein